METILQLLNISKSFPGVKALDGISLDLKKGEIHALLGENGAGKSTLMKILCGIYHHDIGDIKMNGVVKNFKNYLDAIHSGIAIIFQEFSLIPYLNATENIFLNREIKNKLGLLDTNRMRAMTLDILKRLDVKIDIDCPIEKLSVAEQQFIEIAKALSLNAKILILDEPTATLTPNEAERLFKVMRDLKESGVGMFFISHHMEEIFYICDRISVLRDGEYIGTKNTKETNIDELVKMMVGRRVDSEFPIKVDIQDKSNPILNVSELILKKGNNNNKLELYKGEILGLAGLVGSGRTEFVRGLIGADKAYKKKIKLDGKDVKLLDPADSLNKGIGLLPENRKSEGLVLPFSVMSNILINNHDDEKVYSIFINPRKESEKSKYLINKVRVKTPSENTIVNNLSGGNQQKVIIARWLNNNCKVLIFDEPTRGIDIGAKAEIYKLMHQLTKTGISIIMISSELPEIIGLSNRVLVFREGDIVANLEGEDINSNSIMLHATGNIK